MLINDILSSSSSDMERMIDNSKRKGAQKNPYGLNLTSYKVGMKLSGGFTANDIKNNPTPPPSGPVATDHDGPVNQTKLC